MEYFDYLAFLTPRMVLDVHNQYGNWRILLKVMPLFKWKHHEEGRQ